MSAPKKKPIRILSPAAQKARASLDRLRDRTRAKKALADPFHPRMKPEDEYPLMPPTALGTDLARLGGGRRGSWEGFILACRMAEGKDAPKEWAPLAKISRAWREMPLGDRRLATPEALALASGLRPFEVMGLLWDLQNTVGRKTVAAIARSHSPAAVERLAIDALEAGALDAQKALLTITGDMPVSTRGVNVTVDQRKQVVVGEVDGVEEMEASSRRFTKLLRAESKALAAPSDFVLDMHKETVDIERG